MVLRQKDDNSERWTSAADGTVEQRYYYCQNWRSDVVALVGAGGKMKEWVKYTSYGVPMALPAGDTDSDFDCDATDISNIDNWPGGYDVRFDLDLDGDVDSTDSSIASSNYQGVTLGWNVLSNPAIDNVRGYAGYRWKQNTSKYEVRNRFFDPHLGRWTRRDPLGYVDGMSLYEYIRSMPHRATDPFGSSLWDLWEIYKRVKPIAIGLTPSGGCAQEGETTGRSFDCAGHYPPGLERCMCYCMPDNGHGKCMRGCLWCMYEKHDSGFLEAHAKCDFWCCHFHKVECAPNHVALAICLAKCSVQKIPGLDPL